MQCASSKCQMHRNLEQMQDDAPNFGANVHVFFQMLDGAATRARGAGGGGGNVPLGASPAERVAAWFVQRARSVFIVQQQNGIALDTIAQRTGQAVNAAQRGLRLAKNRPRVATGNVIGAACGRHREGVHVL